MPKRRSLRPAPAVVQRATSARPGDIFASRPRSILASWRQRCLVSQAMALALWNAPAFGQNIITPDGRTQTNVAVSGTTTTITTQTVSGGAGYNSFSRFEQAAGTTVNMHLPENTGALVNIVRDGPVVINGILNSYRNGQIGGHVYFSDSAGFTVGASGVINTGRLTVNTPTRDFLDRVIGADGVIDQTMAARLRANDVPISPDGAITINGQINARRGVTLNGHSVSVAGKITTNAAAVDIGERRRQHRAAFAQSVNTSGLQQAGAMVARRGGIEIVAAGTASISGTLNTKAMAQRPAGNIAIRSGASTTIAATARINATGTAPSAAAPSRPGVNAGDGGTLSIVSDGGISIARGAVIDVSGAQGVAAKGGSARIFAGTNLDVESGAVFRGTAGSVGDGGFLELSARQTVTLGAVDVDLSARNGKAGLLYIDPTDIVIGTGGSANMITNGTNVSLEATNSITIAGDGVIDTRNFNRSANGGALSVANPSLGNSGNITLTAPNITVAGSLLAGVVNSGNTAYSAGDVTLDASKSHVVIAGLAQATSTISVTGAITGRDVKVLADATAVASYTNPDVTLGALVAQSAASVILGLNGGYVASRVESRVDIGATAVITGTRDVVLSAKARQEASMPAMTLSGATPAGAAVIVGEIDGVVTTDVASGASVSAGRNLSVTAHNEVTLAASALSVSGGQTRVNATVAYGHVDVATSAIVHSGAAVTVGTGGNVLVSAYNQNSFSTSATAVALSGGVVGLSVAYSDINATAQARLGASIVQGGAYLGNVTVEAISNTEKNATSSSVTVGNNLVTGFRTVGFGIAADINTMFGQLSSLTSSSALGKFGSSVTYAKSNLGASASIAADAGASPAQIPNIVTGGNVVVASRQRDFAVRVSAESGVNSESTNPLASNPSATIALSAGVVYGDFSHTSTASIGSGVSVDAYHIGVGATNEMPISNTWTDWAGLGETISHLNGSLGIVSNILTSYANATSESRELGLAGSVNYYTVRNDTSAYIASGARLHQRSGYGSWTSTLSDGASVTWDKGVSVQALTVTESIDVAGNFSLFSLTGSSGGAGSAVGGSFLDLGRSSSTVAAIAAGAILDVSEVSVSAKTEDKIFAIAPTSGKAAGDVAANGIVTLVGLNNHTLASISNAADISAVNVSVKADQLVSLFSLTGAVAYSGANGIGVSVAALDAAAVTRAYIGDNANDLSGGRLGSGYGPGLITARNLDVAATTDGRITAAAVATAISDPNASKLSILKSGWASFKSAIGEGDAAARAAGSGAVSLSAAGSAAFAMTTFGTSAWVDNSVLTNYAGGGLYTNVQALNSTISEIAAGSAALNLARNSSPLSGALAGAVALGIFDNSTDARIAGSELTGVDDLSVQAVSGGRATVVGVSVAAARPNSAAAAVSAAVGLVTNGVNAAIADSDVTGRGITINSARVNAYQSTDIGIGGGAMYAGADAALGISVTYAAVRDPSGRDAVGAIVSNSALVNLGGLEVTATSMSRIVSGAISGGLGSQSNGLAGSFVINEISPTIRADISGRAGALPSIHAGRVKVVADGGRNAVLDAAIADLNASTDLSQIDFTARNSNGGVANGDGASIVAMASTVQIGQNNAGVALLLNTIAQSHLATIDWADVVAGNVVVRAVDSSIITGIAVGIGGASGQFAGTASVLTQSIDNTVLARIGGAGTSVSSNNDITLTANASSTIRGSAGSLGVGIGAAAAGLSIVDNSIANTVSAEVTGANLRAANDVVLDARSTADIQTVAIGVAISRNVGLAGSIANNSAATDVGATIVGADIIAGNNLGVFAANSDRIGVVAGALGVTVAAPSVAGGLSVVNNSIEGATTASISDSTVDARAGGSGSLSYNAGQLVSAFDLSAANGPSSAQPSLAMAARSIHGFGVVATSQQSVLANAVTGAVSIFPVSGAVAIVPIRNVLAGSTSAVIDDSLVNTRLTGADSTAVAVEAASHSYAATFIVAGAIGGAAAAGADANTVMRRSTRAALTDSTVGTTTPGFTGAGVTALGIAANASQSAASNVIGFAAGLAGAAASGVVNSFEAQTIATLDQGLVTAGRVSVTAESGNGFFAQAAVGAAGAAGFGGAFVVGTSRNTTLATIGGGSGQTVLNLNGALAVTATSANDFGTLAAGGAIGGFAGVAGMVSFVDVENQTRAGLYGASVSVRPGATQVVNGMTSSAGINVTAYETSRIAATTGAGAGGLLGAGAAANIASLDSRVLADIVSSTLSAPGAVAVSATSDRSVDAQTVTFAVGSTLGIGAAVGVISVGTGAPSGAQGEVNAGGDGTLSRVNQLTAGNAGLVLSASGLAAYRSYRGAAGATMSEGDLRNAAQAEYNLLLANGTVSGGALSLTTSGIAGLRSAAASALGIPSPSDQQVRDWATQRYAALTGGAVGYLLSDAGVNAYRTRVSVQDASDEQVRSAANDAYARLVANGTVTNGVLTLNAAGIAAYRAEASIGLDQAATDAEVLDYAARQYAFFGANRSRVAAPASQSATALLDGAGSATAATITGGNIASGSIAVAALSRTATSNLAYGEARGGTVGVGAATAYTNIGDDVSANLAPTTASTGAISVTANSTDGAGAAARVEATAGAGALGAAAGAAVAEGSISNQVTATLGGALTTTGTATVNAANSQTVRTDAYGATVAGGLALGISLANSAATSKVVANSEANSSFTGTGLSINASSTGAAYAAAVAGAGGLLAAGAGADASASDDSTVSAKIDAGARANVGAGAITVAATAAPDAKASARGRAVGGGLAVGAAIATATVNPNVRAMIEGNGSLPASQFTAGTLSVLATGLVFGTPVGDAAELPGATGSFTRGGTSAAASAIAGSGAYYASAVGTDAWARNTASVTASIGNNVRLPVGAVTVGARNTTTQAATATGITAGTAAIGAVEARADSDTTTMATLGNGVTMAANGAGSFALTATGSDTQIVHAEAGSGGLYAGSGAVGSTSNRSTVTAAIGAGAVINTGLVSIAASHVDRYAGLVDSLQASALGASAALASHSADVDVLTSLGAGSRITATGPNTAGCYLSSCLQAVSLTSRNVFTQLGLGDSVQAAAGGGINGAGATSTTEIEGTSRVVLGDNVVLASGASPTSAPGPILLQAWTELTGNDTASLSTGGLLQGSGVSTRYRAEVDNAVTLGVSNALSSFGAINIGTYTTASARTNAYVSTYGLAGVGLADADVTIVTNNNVDIGVNSTLIGLDNVNLTAGRDGSGLRFNSLSGSAAALGYVRGLIAVPDADASTDLQNHARLTIGRGTNVSSAQNVTLGAYDGQLSANADGTGHGYQLYFIPVTSGSSSPGASSTSVVEMNGTATAGIYNTQRIEIGCGANAALECGPNDTPVIRFVSGAPVFTTYNPSFDTVSYINANYDPAVAATLIGGVNTAPVKAVRLSQLYAAGGNVLVNAGRIEGAGTLRANGGPTITVINRSAAYLVLDGGALIPETPGGQILVTGAALGLGGLTRQQNAGALPTITIDNAYQGVADASGNGPALLVGGAITNLAGLVSINNSTGSFGVANANIEAQQFFVTVPNGAVAVSNTGPNGTYVAGAAPQSQWSNAIFFPGGNPQNTVSFNIGQAIDAVASGLYSNSAVSYSDQLNDMLYGHIGDGASGRAYSIMFYTNCKAYTGDAGYGCSQGSYEFGGPLGGVWFDRLNYLNPTRTQPASAAQGGGGQVYGGQIAIKASTININAPITAGRATNYSIQFDASLDTELARIRADYQRAVGDNPAANPFYTLGDQYASVVSAGDTRVAYQYDARNNQLVLGNVNASSGGGSILLDGAVISTSTIGKINLVGGFGNVRIYNNSTADIVANNINTGNTQAAAAGTARITIIDRLVSQVDPAALNTTTYIYQPGVGTNVYKTMNGALPVLTGPNATTPYRFVSGDTTSYDPVAGARYEWTLQATLQRTGQDFNTLHAYGNWAFSSGTSNNPWVYIPAPVTDLGNYNIGPYNYLLFPPHELPPFRVQPSGNTSTEPTGTVVIRRELANTAFIETMYGGISQASAYGVNYDNCNHGAPNTCDRGFTAPNSNSNSATWWWVMPTQAWINLHNSAKADNQIAISFAGNQTGLVSISSNSSVTLNGNIVNPAGSTYVTAYGGAGNISQGPGASILSGNLSLSATGGIGSTAGPVNATLTAGSRLVATAGLGGINLSLDSGALVQTLTADRNAAGYGDINVRAAGSLEKMASGATNIVGRNITLASQNGSIGSVADPFTMRAVATLLPNGSSSGGVVNLSARGDIGITQVAGDLRVGQIASETGDIRIDVSAGRLVSASGQTAAQALSADQISQVSRALRLTSADGAAAAAQASIAAFEKQVTQSYALYSALIGNGSVSNGVFTLNRNATALYQAFANAELGRAATWQEVAAYAARRYAAYASVFETAYGAGWRSMVRFDPATLVSDFSFSAQATDAASGLATRIAGDAVWTDRQLISAINQSALQPASGAVGNGTALVVGHDVTLNIAGSIGSLAPDMQVSLDSIRSGSISDAQLAALSVASTPGTVKIMGQRPDGSLVEVNDLNNVPAGVTLTRVDVKQTAPLFVNATGTFSGSAQGDIYLQSTATPQSAGGTLTIGQVTATGTINLQAPQAITVATNAGGAPRSPVQIQTNGDLVLVAGGGSIGSAATPLTYRIGGRLVSASAGAGDAYLVAAAGTAEIGRIFASGTASLTANAGGIQGYLPGVAISAGSILLNAAGNVGSGSAALGLQVGVGGEVSGQIGGAAWLSAPAISGQAASPLRIGGLSATNGATVTADGEVRILRNLRSSNGAVSITGGKLVMAAGADVTAAGRVGLAAASDLVLGTVKSVWAAPAGAASIAITAAGSIQSNGDSGALLDANVAGGAIDLQAGTGIGSPTEAVAFAAPALSASSLAGNIHVATSGATHVANLIADAGTASLVAGGNLVIDTVATGGATHIEATAGTLKVGSLMARANSTLSASGAITLGDATMAAGDLSITSTGGNLSLAGLDIAGGISLTAATSIRATGAIIAGGTMDIAALNGTLTLNSLAAGGATTLEATGLISLTSATTSAGDFSADSTGAGITAGTIGAAGSARLTAAGPVSVTSELTAGGAARVSTTNGVLGIAGLSAGASSILSASGAITLGDSRTTAGDLSITSTGGNLSLAGLDIAGRLSLMAATSIAATGTVAAGGALGITAQNGALTLRNLLTGGTTTLEAAGLVSLTTARSSAGDISAASGAAGITAGTIEAAGTATLTAAGPIAVTTALRVGGAAVVSVVGATLDIASLAATRSTLSASGAITLGAAAIVEDLSVHSSTGAISAAELTAGGGASIDAAGTLALGSVFAGNQGLAARSRNAGITADALRSDGDLVLTGPGAIALGSLSGRDVEVSASAGSLTIAALQAAGRATLRTGAALSVSRLAAGTTADIEAPGQITLGDLSAGADARLVSTGAGVIFSTVSAGGSAIILAQGSIDGGAVTVRDDLALLAGRSGQGSIAVGRGSAGRLAAGAPDEIRLGRFSAGESIVIAGRRIAADIVQAAGARQPLALDIVGFGLGTADRVDFAVAADSVRIGRFAATDARLVTTAERIGIAEAMIPGALTLATPHVTVFANNRSLAPDYGYDVQLYSQGRPFRLDLNGARLTTNAYIIRFDSDVADIPPSAGMSLTGEVSRLGSLLTTGGIPGDFGGGLGSGKRGDERGFWAGFGARGWDGGFFGRSLGFVLAGQPGKPSVNLDETEDRP